MSKKEKAYRAFYGFSPEEEIDEDELVHFNPEQERMHGDEDPYSDY